MSLLPLIAAIVGLAVIALLLVEYYRQPLLAVAVVAIGFWVVLAAAWAVADEWRR